MIWERGKRYNLNPEDFKQGTYSDSYMYFNAYGETLVCGHSNESYWAVLSCGNRCFIDNHDGNGNVAKQKV